MPASSPLPETSQTQSSRRLPQPGRDATTKSPANGVPPADRSADSAYQPGGSAGSMPWLMIRSRRSTSIDSPIAPATPSRERRNEVSSTMNPTTKITATAITTRGVRGRASVLVTTTARAVTTARLNTTNHGRFRGPSTRWASTIGTIRSVIGQKSGHSRDQGTEEGRERDQEDQPVRLDRGGPTAHPCHRSAQAPTEGGGVDRFMSAFTSA